MAKDLIVYKAPNKGKTAKGNIWARRKAVGRKMKMGYTKTAGNIAKGYKKYGGPTAKVFQKTGAAALGVGKFALKRGALGFPGLIATGAYYGAKHIIGKGEKVAKRSATKQWHQRDRHGKTRWYL